MKHIDNGWFGRTCWLAIFGLSFTFCQNKEIEEEEPPHIVFVTGDEEYRSEESMPMIAKIINRELGAKISMCYSLDSMGIIDPNNSKNISRLEALETADLMVMFTRFRALPDNQLKMITDYVESGKPVVGFRTSTHAFMYKEDSTKMHMNNEWPTKLFGQQWITHHGHFDDGANPMTSVTLIEGKKNPILNGVEPFDAYSWLYHVDGGKWKLYGDSDPFLVGKSLKSNHEMNDRLDEFALTNPVAWTKSYNYNGIKSRVFFTTLGHPYDFKNSSMRVLALNGIYWALGREDEIPITGVNSTIVGEYDPNNSGFGQKFKQGLKPISIP